VSQDGGHWPRSPRSETSGSQADDELSAWLPAQGLGRGEGASLTHEALWMPCTAFLIKMLAETAQQQRLQVVDGAVRRSYEALGDRRLKGAITRGNGGFKEPSPSLSQTPLRMQHEDPLLKAEWAS